MAAADDRSRGSAQALGQVKHEALEGTERRRVGQRPLKNLTQYVQQNDLVIVEPRGLVCLPSSEADAPYQKGLAIRKVGSDIYDVAAVHALFRGGQFAGAEIAQGYRYKLADGRLVRSCDAEDCPCGDPYRHRLHIQALALLDDMLNTASVTKTANVVTVL